MITGERKEDGSIFFSFLLILFYETGGGPVVEKKS